MRRKVEDAFYLLIYVLFIAGSAMFYLVVFAAVLKIAFMILTGAWP